MTRTDICQKDICLTTVALVTLLLCISSAFAGVVPEAQRSTHPVVDRQSVVAPTEIVDLGGTWQTTSMGQKSVFGPGGNFTPPSTDAKWTPMEIPGKHHVDWVCWYRRMVNIPKTWAGKRVTVQFRGTLHKTDVYWNHQLVHTQFDGNYGYDVDVTPYLRPGEKNELMVGTANYPVGHPPVTLPFVASQYRGIFMPVSLVVSDPVRITDVFAKPSVKRGKLDLEVTVDSLKTAPEDKPRTLSLRAWVKDDGKTIKKFPLKNITLTPGKEKVVELSIAWKDAELWWPHRPYLYRTGVELYEKGKPIGGKTVRFGFREFEIRKHLIYINGKKLFTRRHSILPYRKYWLDGTVARQMLDTDRKRGYNAIRTHHWAHDYVNEVADEEGFLVFCEMPIKGHNLPEDKTSQAWRLSREHVEGVVRQGRNHPSVLMWNICNEITYYSKDKIAIHIERLDELGKLALKLDPTRTVHYDGDKDLAGRAPTASLHYPWQVFKPSRMLPGRAYWLDEKRAPWMGWIWQKDKPLSIGEYVFPIYSLKLPQGMTYLAGDDTFVNPDGWIRAWLKAIKWLNEGYASAEVFCLNPWDVPDRMYETGPVLRPITLAMRQKYTTFFSGEKVRRTFHVYNHTLVDRKFVLAVQLEREGKSIFNKRIAIPLPGGESKTLHVSIPLPRVSTKTEFRFNAELLEDGKAATDGETDTWSVFPRLKQSDWPTVRVAVITRKPKMLPRLRQAGLKCAAPKSIESAITSGVKLILIAGMKLSPQDGAQLTEYVSHGGRVVMLNTPNGSWLPGGAMVAGGGNHFSNHAFPAVAKHEALNNLQASDLALWRPDTMICRATFTKPAGTALRTILDAGGLSGMQWAPLMELPLGQGRFILCQMLLTDRLGVEPAAGFLLANLLRAASRPAEAPGGTLRAYVPAKTPMRKVFKKLRVAMAKKTTDARVVLIDGTLPAKTFQKTLTHSLPASKTIMLHNLTPATAALAAKALSVPITLAEEKPISQIIRAGRDPLIDGLSNDDFFWQTGQFGCTWKQYQTKPTTTLCQYALDAAKSPGWRVLTKPAALAVREKDGRTIVLDQILWGRGADIEVVRCQRVGGALLANLGVSIGGRESAAVKKLSFVDLRKVVNRGFVDEVAGDGKGGWTDQGPRWDMRFFPVNLVGLDRNGLGCPKEVFPKRSTMGRCDFKLIDPEKNDGKSCLVLKGGKDRSQTIPLGKTAEAVWFLHVAEVGRNVKTPVEIAEVIFTYEDGTTAKQTFCNLFELADWRETNPIQLGQQGWQGYCVQHDPVSVYTYRWENPHPKKQIREITITPKNGKTYILTAVTLERSSGDSR